MNRGLCLILILSIVFLLHTDAKRIRKGHRRHDKPPKFDHEDHDDDGDKDRKEECSHGKDGKHDRGMNQCGKQHWARILVGVGAGVTVIAITAGITICVCRYKKKQRQQVSDSKVNLQPKHNKREALYIVDVDANDLPPPYSQEKPSAPPGYPVVSTQELPGKQ